MNHIYAVTVFQKISKDPDIKNPYIFDYGDRRCVGWFNNLEEAEFAVEQNINNIHDGMYNYAIIEEMLPGIFTKDISRRVYKWELNQYIRIAIPTELKHASNFGIG